MFTGLIEDVGEIVALARSAAGARVTVRTALPAADLALGASLAVDGCCLTVIARGGDRYAFDASAETLERTTLGRRAAGDAVNLERPLTLSARLGGHLVLGHVDGVGAVELRERVGDAERWRFSLPSALAPLVAEKGSIAVDGVSLTVNAVSARSFEVMLIPETLRKTAFAGKRAGDGVNLETDILAKHVARLLSAKSAASAEGE